MSENIIGQGKKTFQDQLIIRYHPNIIDCKIKINNIFTKLLPKKEIILFGNYQILILYKNRDYKVRSISKTFCQIVYFEEMLEDNGMDDKDMKATAEFSVEPNCKVVYPKLKKTEKDGASCNILINGEITVTLFNTAKLNTAKSLDLNSDCEENEELNEELDEDISECEMDVKQIEDQIYEIKKDSTLTWQIEEGANIPIEVLLEMELGALDQLLETQKNQNAKNQNPNNHVDRHAYRNRGKQRKQKSSGRIGRRGRKIIPNSENQLGRDDLS